MSEEEELGKKRRRKRRGAETDEVRLLANIARKNPTLFRTLDEYSRKTGQKKTMIVQEALHHYILERRLIQSQLSVAELYEAFQVIKELKDDIRKDFVTSAQLLLSDEFQSIMELSRTLGVPTPEIKVKPTKKAKEIEERILDKLWNIMEPVLDWATEQAIKGMFKMSGRPPPKLPGMKVKVTLEEEEEEKVPIEVK